jgi:hypothetical protein
LDPRGKRWLIGGWRKSRNEKLHNLHISRNIIKVIKSRRMRWAAYVKCTGRCKLCAKFLVTNLKVIDDLEDLCVIGRTISNTILKKEECGTIHRTLKNKTRK